jgi:endonuclease/exonuclease/phosphatase family metal-dependent hydrolase
MQTKQKIFVLIIFLCAEFFSQSHVKVMSYNLLNYPGNDTVVRNPYFRKILSTINPDVLVVQEITSQSGVDGFLNNVLNSFGQVYQSGVFYDGPDTDNNIYFKSSLFKFIQNNRIPTILRDINEFILVHKISGDTLRIYSVHLKSSTGTSNENQRLQEVDSLRKRTNVFPNGTEFIVCGDFNIYNSNEPAYQKLIEDQINNDGHFIDPISIPYPNSWNNIANKSLHTQSTRTRSFNGGSTGGLDDRFDMILVSNAINQPGNINIVSNSFVCFGNDGNHYNDSINKQPNTAVSVDVANALHYASDHLPIYFELEFEAAPAPDTIKLPIKVFLQGPYNTGSMNTSLNNYIPLQQPYNISPWNYNGLEYQSVIPSNTVDWVLVELRNTLVTVTARRACLLTNDGTVLDTNGFYYLTFSGIIPGYYYISIQHRNHLSIMSRDSIFLSNNSVLYDFTLSQNQAFGTNSMKPLAGGVYGMYAGDGNANGSITSTDKNNIWRMQNGSTGYKSGDYNLNGSVTATDANTFWRSNNGISTQIPTSYK